MTNARLAALSGAVGLALCGVAHATGPALPSLPSSPIAVSTAAVGPAAVAVHPAHALAAAQPPALRAEAVQLAVNTFDAARPAARAAAAQGDAAPSDASAPQLHGASRYLQDVGAFWNAPEASPKIAEVPLPGALWLFGSALLAFLAIAVRRKF